MQILVEQTIFLPYAYVCLNAVLILPCTLRERLICTKFILMNFIYEEMLKCNTHIICSIIIIYCELLFP